MSLAAGEAGAALTQALAQAFSAGRYAAFVWPAYAVTAVGFVWMVVDTLGRARRWRRKIDELERSRDP